ncbi:MAG: DUF4339 domain-containing protein [Verrucomicrobiota bacterium]
MDFYYSVKGEKAGPVDELALHALRKENTIDSETLVWRAGMQEWMPYGSLFPPAGPPLQGTPPPIQVPEKAEDLANRDLTVDTAGLIGQGWEWFIRHCASVVGASAVVFVLYMAASFVPYIGPFIYALVVGPLIGGLYWYCLRVVRSGKPPRFEEVFIGFQRQIVPLLLYGLAISALSFFPFFVGGLFGGIFAFLEPVVAMIGGILLTVVGIIVGQFLYTRMMFIPMLILDKGLGFPEAFKVSWAVTGRKLWGCLLFYFLVVLITLSGLLLCIIGLVFTQVVGILIVVCLYEQVFGPKKDTLSPEQAIVPGS